MSRAAARPGYRKLLIALFCAGIATFAQLYAPQSVLPIIARSAQVSPDTAALCISVATGALALGVLPWAVVAARIGRARTISIAIAGSALIGCAIPFAPTFALFLTGRAIEGFLLAAVPAVAVAYLAEQVDAADTAPAAGVYVAGTTVGGLLGRVVSGPLSELFGWRTALLVVALGGLTAAVLFITLAPRRTPSTNERSMQGFLSRLARTYLSGPLLLMYLQPFLLMGVFVALYNYLGFRLEAAPFAFSATAVSLLYFTYLAGTFAAARAGSLVQRLGFKRATMLSQAAMFVGLALTLSSNASVIIAGLVLHTAGFFAAHAALTSWTPLVARGLAAEASAGYSLAYYLGSSLIGWAAGLLLAQLGWQLTIAALMLIVVVAAVLTFSSREPAAGPGRNASGPRS
ncbi:putative MFS family arabinose efflux permease [Leucobacter exalbidus]|uniref:MFS family arabinose efflux permease n=1 Tax=Leucobacter exalbidus TaxID=662960 RepID=A0A940PQY5_9MICO|nr:MFS transporter [Leucobacter exalbidus]MBP1325954.1 putative MFS family arabinose efflux permease [Leucobacter exalbidus]